MAEQYLGHVQVQRMEQSLTPQMLQSLKILQVPILDLQTMIREEMDQNPTLERDAPETEESTDFAEAARDELREERELGELTELAEWDADFRSNREVRSSQTDNDRYQFKMDSIEGAASPQALSRQRLVRLIRRAGRTPVERDSLYRELKREPAGC